MEFKNEIWKDIKDYENLYQVSTEGRVRRVKKTDNGIKVVMFCNGREDKENNPIVYLNKNDEKQSYKIQELVAEAFIENPNNFVSVRHKDNNKKNNNVDNLEWIEGNNLTSQYGNKTMKEFIIRDSFKNSGGYCYFNPSFEQTKGRIDYFIEIIYDRINVIDFIISFAYSGFISNDELNEAINKPLNETKFYDYLLNDLRIYCIKLYGEQNYFEKTKCMAFALKQILKRWINNIDKSINEDQKRNIFEKALKYRSKLKQTDFK